MKKMIIVLFIFLVIFSGIKEKKEFSLLDYFAGDYTSYTNQYCNEESIDLGFCYANLDQKNEKIVGESVVVENLEIGNALEVLRASVLKSEYLNDGTVVIYAKTPLINDCVDVSYGKVNLQIATRGSRSVVGWPLILGSY